MALRFPVLLIHFCAVVSSCSSQRKILSLTENKTKCILLKNNQIRYYTHELSLEELHVCAIRSGRFRKCVFFSCFRPQNPQMPLYQSLSSQNLFSNLESIYCILHCAQKLAKTINQKKKELELSIYVWKKIPFSKRQFLPHEEITLSNGLIAGINNGQVWNIPRKCYPLFLNNHYWVVVK